eukprot:1157624-Pelagomonas_calceolata.AAC.11
MKFWSPYLTETHDCEPELTTSRAVYLSNRHSRSLTVFSALQRLGVLPGNSHTQQQEGKEGGGALQDHKGSNKDSWACVRRWQPGEQLRITIAGVTFMEIKCDRLAMPCMPALPLKHTCWHRLTASCTPALKMQPQPHGCGADRNEGTNALESAVRFGELLRLCAAAGVRDVRLLFCGPGLCISNWEQGSGAVASSFAIAVHAALKKEGASYESSKRAQIQNAHTLSTGEHGGLKCNLRLMPAHLNRGP